MNDIKVLQKKKPNQRKMFTNVTKKKVNMTCVKTPHTKS